MQLTRVTSGRAESAKPVVHGGDADLLALLLTGDQGSGLAFPATLEAARGGNDVAAESSALGDMPGDGKGDGAAGSSDDDTSATEIGIAAALALAGVVANAVAAQPKDATVAVPGDGADALGAAAAVLGADAAALAGSAPVGSASGVTATADTVVAGTVAVASAPPGAITTTAKASAATKTVDDGAAAAASALPTEGFVDGGGADAALATTSGDPSGPGASTASQEVAGTHAAGVATPTHGDGTPSTHGGAQVRAYGAGAEVAREGASFASGGGEHHGLDLGTPERQRAAVALEKATHVAAPASSTGVPLEPLPGIHTDAVDATAGGQPVTAATSSATTTTRDATPARLAPAAHLPGELAPRWSERVVDAVRLSGIRGGGEIRLQLEPEGLGHIDVRLHLQGDGVRAMIVAEHESTRALLTSQQHVLHDAFSRSDVRLSGFSVDVGSGGGAASFARPDDGREGDGGSASPAPTVAPATAGDDGTGQPPVLAAGRVSVRV
jgi:flagellar hook-length control protein FliK